MLLINLVVGQIEEVSKHITRKPCTKKKGSKKVPVRGPDVLEEHSSSEKQ